MKPPATVPAAVPLPPPQPAASPAAPPPVVRRPVPDKAALAASRKEYRELFAAELNDKSPPARRALAMKLLDGAAQCADKPPDQYVLLAGARQAAVDARDLSLCFGAADALGAAFDVDAAVKAEAVQTAGLQGPTPSATAGNCQQALTILDDLSDAEDYAAAARLAAAMQKAAADDPFLKRVVPRRAKEVEALRVASDRVARDLDKLRAAPDDPAANQSVGS